MVVIGGGTAHDWGTHCKPYGMIRIILRLLVPPESWMRTTRRRYSVVAAAIALLLLSQRLPAQSEPVTGSEFGAAVNFPKRNLRGDALLFVPRDVKRIRAAVVIINFGDLSRQVYGARALRGALNESESVLVFARLATIQPPNGNIPIAMQLLRNAAVGGDEILLSLLQRLAEESGHRELRDAKLLFWGWSQAASFGATFAALHPERTVAFVRYHGHRRGLDAQLAAIASIPALSIAGAKDETAGTEDAQSFWQSGRAVGAPWTFAVEPEATHGSLAVHEGTLNSLTIPWIAGVLRHRLSPSGALQRVMDNRAWLGDNATFAIAPQNTFSGDPRTVTWLPDEVTSQGWRKTGSR